jgi:hypothetical protein
VVLNWTAGFTEVRSGTRAMDASTAAEIVAMSSTTAAQALNGVAFSEF